MDPSAASLPSSYPDSASSSPRSWAAADEPSPKLRLMCSYGGRIVPRPTDKSLCYLGGDTRIVVFDRLSSLSDLLSKLSRSLSISTPFSLKYQLPNEDLDSLITLTTDEDLDNLVDEYDRIASHSHHPLPKSSRIRLFLFPNNPTTAEDRSSAPSSIASINSLLDDSKSETWFVDALNGALLGRDLSTDSTQSVNCLLGLEDDSSRNGRSNLADVFRRPDSTGKSLRNGVQDVPDSPMLDTTSSFGSASSALSNLPPIRVRADDRPPDQRYGANLDEQFGQMNISNPQNLAAAPVATVASTISPTENPNMNRVVGSDEEKPDTRKQQAVPISQPKPSPIEVSVTESRPFYYQERMPPAAAAAPAVNPVPELKREDPVTDPGTTSRVQQVPVPVPESQYVVPPIAAPEQQLHPLAHPQSQIPQQQQPQQQPQFIPTNPQFVPYPSYYQVPHPMQQQSQQFNPNSMPMYYVPVGQNHQGQPQLAQQQTVPLPKVVPQKPDLQPSIYRTAAPPPAQMVQVAAGAPGMGYHFVQHHHPSQAPAPTAVTAAAAPQMVNYGYEYANTGTETMHPQVYYTQSTMPPVIPPQYQTSQYQAVMSETQQGGEVKQNRAT